MGGPGSEQDEGEDAPLKPITIYSEALFDGVSSKRKLPATPDSYPVTFKVTIVLGVPGMHINIRGIYYSRSTASDLL